MGHQQLVPQQTLAYTQEAAGSLRHRQLKIMAVTVGDICKIVLAVILPPLGVFAEKEKCDKDVLINILLTLLGYIPGRCLSRDVGRIA